MPLPIACRPDQITFPEPDFNTSFSSVSDLHFSKLLSSSPVSYLSRVSPCLIVILLQMAGFFQMEVETDRSLILSDFASSPPPRAGSIKGTTPITELSFTANPKDISIEEGEPEKHLVGTIHSQPVFHSFLVLFTVYSWRPL